MRIAWRGTRAARRCQLPDRLAEDTYRQAPSASNSQSLQPPPGGTVYTARQKLFQEPLFVSLPPGGAYPTAIKLTKSATTAWWDSLHRQADAVPGAIVRVAAAWRSLSNRQAPSSPEPHWVLAIAWRSPFHSQAP